MNNKCSNCNLVNFTSAEACKRCGLPFGESENIPSNRGFLKSPLLRRAVVFIVVCIVALLGFYTSLLFSAARPTYEERKTVAEAIELLDEKGFDDEAFLLRNLAAFRTNDNWLNASVEKENAYAATNFPFEIVTLYPDFFTKPVDATERAVILLHEAKHLQGKDEKEAYEFVWKNRHRLGWTFRNYSESEMWHSVRKLTTEYVPELFLCFEKLDDDCTE